MSAVTSILEGRPLSLMTIVAIITLHAPYLLYKFINKLLVHNQRSIFISKHGCKPYAAFPHKDPLFGLDLFLENVRFTKTGGIWISTAQRYSNINNGVNTFSSLLLGETLIKTAEPENIKAVLATHFKDFELPTRQEEYFQPVFGRGIFSTDGKEWEASRMLLRPNFVRNQIADLRTFEKHVGRLMERIPRGGETVDLQSLFLCLTIDSGEPFHTFSFWEMGVLIGRKLRNSCLGRAPMSLVLAI
jgi:hypothetical protein